MSTQSHYEINVSLNGSHLFATHERSCRDKEPTKKLVELFREKFPETEGYKVDCTYWAASGQKTTF